ncbi:MAG TPA: phage tail protein [Gemmatimonadaceae bacterium]
MHGRLPIAALAALASLSLCPPLAGAQGVRSAQRSVVASTGSALVVDGAPVAVGSAEGGVLTADVIAAQAGPDGSTKKHLGPTRVEDLVVQVGLDSKEMLDWIGATWRGNAAPKNVTLQTADHNRKVVAEREFSNAQIVETTIPALDGSSKERGWITVRVAAQGVSQKAGSGAMSSAAAVGAKQKAWMTSNFRLRLGNLPANRVSRIESFTVSTGTPSSARGAGASREAVRAAPAGGDRIPNLTVTFSDADAKAWTDWYDAFVVKGNNGDAAEVNGAIELLGPDLKEPMATITLGNCGIVRLAPAAAEGAGDRVARTTAELYCERMTLDSGATM